MKTTVILFSGLCCLCVIGCKDSKDIAVFRPQTGPPLFMPSIIANIEADPNMFSHLAFQWAYRAHGVIHAKNSAVSSTQWVEGSLENVPRPTANYTRDLIVKLFLSKPWEFGAGVDHITLENFNENAIGILQFEPLKYADVGEGFKDIWPYRLAIDPIYRDEYGGKHSGKRFTLERLLVSQNGHILYRGHNGPRGWTVSSCRQTSEGLVLTIMDDVQENWKDEELPATSTQYLYRFGASSLRRLKCEKITISNFAYYGSDFYR
ncbi:MAG: hypothetical protein ACYS32_01925 [Planctomycetota bacterium]